MIEGFRQRNGENLEYGKREVFPLVGWHERRHSQKWEKTKEGEGVWQDILLDTKYSLSARMGFGTGKWVSKWMRLQMQLELLNLWGWGRAVVWEKPWRQVEKKLHNLNAFHLSEKGNIICSLNSAFKSQHFTAPRREHRAAFSPRESPGVEWKSG